MAYIKPRIMMWGPSSDPDVVAYIVRWAIPPQEIVYDPTINPGVNVGNVTQVTLPIPGMPYIDGMLTLGITAVDEMGNESDPAQGTFPFDWTAPSAPTNLRVI